MGERGSREYSVTIINFIVGELRLSIDVIDESYKLVMEVHYVFLE